MEEAEREAYERGFENGRKVVLLGREKERGRENVKRSSLAAEAPASTHLLEIAAAERAAYERVIDYVPETPEHWDDWSIERQLGYNGCWLDIKKQLTPKYLTPREDK